jgi:hypothetical protein
VLSRDEPGAGVQTLEQGLGRVEFTAEFFQHGCVVKTRQFRLLLT